MAKRQMNWIMALVVLLALMVLTVTAVGIRKWQRSRMEQNSYQLGLEAYENGNWDDAAHNLGRYLAINPNDLPILLKYAEAHLNISPLKRENVQQAIMSYRSVLRLDTLNKTAAQQLVTIYLQMNVYPEAELIARRYLNVFPDDPEFTIYLARALTGQREFEKAGNMLKELITAEPEHIQAYELLGKLAETRPGLFDKTARQWFDKAIQDNPVSAEARIVRAAYFIRNSDYSNANDDLARAEQMDLSDHSVRLQLAIELANINLFDRSRDQLAVIRKERPDWPEFWLASAKIAQKAHIRSEMLEVARQGLHELGEQKWGFLPLAVELYIAAEEYDQAAFHLEELKANNAAESRVDFLEGLLAKKQNQNQKAIMSWQRASQAGDDSERTMLALAIAFRDAGDTQSAIAQLRSLIMQQPDSFRGHLELAKMLNTAGNTQDALSQAETALRIAPNNLSVILTHLQIYIQTLSQQGTPADSPKWLEVESRLKNISQSTDSTEVRLIQLQLAMHRNEYGIARNLIAELKTDNPNMLEISLAEIDLLLNDGQTEDAIEQLFICTEQFPNEMLPVRYLAEILSTHGDQSRCEQVLKAALGRFTNPADRRQITILLTNYYDKWGWEDQACKLLLAMEQELPDEIPLKRKLLDYQQIVTDEELAQRLVDDIRNIEGNSGWQWRIEQVKLWFEQESFDLNYNQIVTLLEENLSANPDDQTSRLLLATAHKKAGNLDLAISAYTDALNRSPDDVRVIVPTIAALYQAREYDQADRILNQASRTVEHPMLSRLEFESFLRRGQIDSAENILEDLMASDPDQTIALSLALLKMRQGEYARAYEILGHLRRENPDSVPVAAALVELNILNNDFDQALGICNDMISTHANASTHILRGKTHLMLGDTEKAGLDFYKAVDLEPKNTQALMFRSDFYRRTGNTERAIADARHAMEIDENSIQIQRRLITLLMSDSDPIKTEQAKVLLERALFSNPNDLYLRLYQAMMLTSQGTSSSYRRAEELFRKVTNDDPRLIQAWLSWAQMYMNQNMDGLAVDVILDGLSKVPQNEQLLILKATVEARRSPEIAIPTLQQLININPDQPQVIQQLADIYINTGREQDAIKLLEDSIESADHTGKKAFRITLARAVDKKANDRGEQMITELTAEYPDDPEVFQGHVQILVDRRQWQEVATLTLDRAQIHPQQALNIGRRMMLHQQPQARQAAETILRGIYEMDQDPAVIESLAMFCQINQRHSEAAELYKQLLKKQPENIIAINNLAWILSEHKGQLEQALQLAQQALRRAPDYIDLIDTAGVIRYRLGNYDQAVSDFTRCIELYPPNAPGRAGSYFRLARTLAAMGQKERAYDELAKAFDLYEKIGGLNQAEISEAKQLLRELSKEDIHATNN